MTLTSPEDLSIAMGIAMSGGGGYQYEATSTCQQGGIDIEQYAIVVHPRALWWSATSLRTGRIESFDPHTLSIRDGEDVMQLSVDRIPRSFPEAVKLAFPLSLPIWGRHHDVYHPMAVEERDNDVVLILRHQTDRALSGSFTFDRESGRAKRLATPTYVLRQEVKLDDSSSGTEFNFGFVAGSPPANFRERTTQEGDQP